MTDKLLLKPEEVAASLGVSRTRVYAWVASGEIASVKLGASRRVEAVELMRFVARLRDGDGSAATPDRRVAAGVA